MEIIQEIVMLYYEINNIYLELYKMELNNDKDNDFFLQLVSILKEKIEEEKELFSKLFEDYEDEFDRLVELADNDNNEMPFSMRLFDYIRFYNHMDIEIDEFDEEDDIMDNYYNHLSCDVLKVAHHGSSGSTSADWLEAVEPEIAVISVGEGNSYGHPTQKVLDKLDNFDCTVYRTDEMGTIVLETDGKSIALKS